jgi:hypothetical protein
VPVLGAVKLWSVGAGLIWPLTAPARRLGGWSWRNRPV